MERSPTYKIYSLCVLCGSIGGKAPEFAQAAGHLGKTLARQKITLVYEGGNQGLRGCVAEAARAENGRVIGIVPAPIKSYLGTTIGEELIIPTMRERLQHMTNHSDAFIALPGGLGTLDGLFRVIYQGLLNLHQKPIGLLNVDHFFDELLSFLDHATAQEFITPIARQNIISATTVEELMEKLQAFTYQPHPVTSRIDWSAERTGAHSLDLSFRLSLPAPK